MNRTEREALRRRFLPERVRLLFVGESPPAGGAFFYAGDSGLFRATRDAFREAFHGFDDGQSFLERFANVGCYLYDLCDEPVNRLTNGRRAAHRAGEAQLTQTFVALRPQVIVVLLKSIAASVNRSVDAAGLAHVERHVLTYPSRWHQHRIVYRAELTALLRDFARQEIIEVNATP
jgi:hypothetical protein